MKLSKFSDQGLKHFEISLRKKEDDFNSTGLIAPISRIEIKKVEFESRYDFAKYINNIFEEVKLDNPKRFNEFDINMWAWISLFYIDYIAPIKNGKRDIKEVYRYIPSTEFRVAYRNILMGSYLLYKRFGKFSRIFLCNKMSEVGDFTEQVFSRTDIAASDSNIEAIDSLYWDEKRKYYKRGAGTAGKPGTLRRFLKVRDQLGINYYLTNVTSENILTMLPDEFDKWKNNEI